MAGLLPEGTPIMLVLARWPERGCKNSYPIDDDPGHILVGRLQGIGKLGIDMQKLHAPVPHCALHDGVRGHLWGIDLQALRADKGAW